jgi:hypothetical protein
LGVISGGRLLEQHEASATGEGSAIGFIDLDHKQRFNTFMNQSGNRSLTTVRRYISDGSLFKKNAAAVLGL